MNTIGNKNFVVDADDIENVKAHQWHIATIGYPCTYINGVQTTLHRYLIDTDAETIDHINGDKTDNRRCNLRPATQMENARNSKMSINNTSGYKGVWWSKEKKKYCAEIRTMKKKKHLGYFISPIDAAKAYDKAAMEYFGSFAKTNFAMK